MKFSYFMPKVDLATDSLSAALSSKNTQHISLLCCVLFFNKTKYTKILEFVIFEFLPLQTKNVVDYDDDDEVEVDDVFSFFSLFLCISSISSLVKQHNSHTIFQMTSNLFLFTLWFCYDNLRLLLCVGLNFNFFFSFQFMLSETLSNI